MDARTVALLAEIMAVYPDIIVSETDYGCTVAVCRPGSGRAIYLARVFRPTRWEDPAMSYVHGLDSLGKIMEALGAQ